MPAPILIPDVYSQDAHGRPDWKALAADPRFFGAILKATEGVSFAAAAQWFSPHWSALRTAGGDRYGTTWFRGAYHYLIFADDPDAQADFYLKTVEAAGGFGPGDIMPIIDVERGRDGASNHGASRQQVIDCTSRWVEKVKAALGGSVPVMLYGRGAMDELAITDRMGCDYLWAPQYNHVLVSTDAIGWPKELVPLWQYTDGRANFTPHPASCPGIGNCDLNVFIAGDDCAALCALLLCFAGEAEPAPAAAVVQS